MNNKLELVGKSNLLSEVFYQSYVYKHFVSMNQ
jgi:hypothetical protein